MGLFKDHSGKELSSGGFLDCLIWNSLYFGMTQIFWIAAVSQKPGNFLRFLCITADWVPHRWTSGKGKKLTGSGVEVRETHLVIEDDLKRISSQYAVSKKHAYQTRSSSMVDKGLLIP